jgi:hypothetical protein
MKSPYDYAFKKVNFKNYLELGAIVSEQADGTRGCVCSNKIKKGEKHLAIYQPNGRFSSKRYNFCHACGIGILSAEQQRLYKLETSIYGMGGA